MKQKSFGKKLILKKETVADLINSEMTYVKGGTIINDTEVCNTDECNTILETCWDTCESVCHVCPAQIVTKTDCVTQCPSGGLPCKTCN